MDKVALITGGNGSLGKAVVQKFLNHGFRVISADLTLPSENEGNLRVHSIALDMTKEMEVQESISRLLTQYGRIDCAVLTVGGFDMGNLFETDIAGIEKQLRLNFFTAYNVVRPVFNDMLARGYGRIVLIGARPALDATQGSFAVGYTFSKSLIFRLAEVLNAESQGKDVVSSVVVPSIIDTPMNRASMPDADTSTWVSPNQIADTISFLVSDAASALRMPVIKLYGNA